MGTIGAVKTLTGLRCPSFTPKRRNAPDAYATLMLGMQHPPRIGLRVYTTAPTPINKLLFTWAAAYRLRSYGVKVNRRPIRVNLTGRRATMGAARIYGVVLPDIELSYNSHGLWCPHQRDRNVTHAFRDSATGTGVQLRISPAIASMAVLLGKTARREDR
jgi:hypothetical protein